MLSETQARVRPARRELARQLGVEPEPVPGVDGEELTRPQARPADADALGERNGARLRGDGDEPVVADRDAERAQAVPVELRPAGDAVREDEPGRTVPRLDRHRVVAAHRALRLVDPGVVLPCGRDEPRQRLLDVEAGADEQLDGVVEERGVGAAAIERRREAGSRPRARSRASIHAALPSIVLISPLWQSRRNGWARSQLGSVFVEKRWWKIANDAVQRCVAEIGVEAGELRRGAERLVRDGAERERGDVDAVDELRAPARPVCTLLGVLLVARREHELRDAGHGRERGRPERRRRRPGRRASRTARAPPRGTPPRRRPRSHGSRRKHIAIPAPGVPVSVSWSGSSTPAPSPVTPSAAQAPRWATAASPASARSTSSRDARPFASATRPMPQASRSRG